MFLFSFSKNNKTHLLMGSMHYYPIELLNHSIYERLLSCTVFVTEHKSILSKALKQYGLLTDSSLAINSVKDLLDIRLREKEIDIFYDEKTQFERLDKKVSEILQEINDPEITLDRLTLDGLGYVSIACISSTGMDYIVEKQYKNQGKEILYLSTQDFALQDKADMDEVWINIQDALYYPEKVTNETSIAHKEYADGIVSIHEVKKSEYIENVNTNWLSKSNPNNINILHTKLYNALFMVGYMHLFGPTGLLQKFLEEGYELQRIDDNNIATPFSINDLEVLEALAPYNSFKYEEEGEFTESDKDNLIKFLESHNMEHKYDATLEEVQALELPMTIHIVGDAGYAAS